MPHLSVLDRMVTGAGVSVLLTSCGSNNGTNSPDNAANTFSVNGRVAGNADVVYQNGKCKFAEASFEPGQSAVLRGADNTILATDQLKIGPDQFVGNMGVCFLTFHFDRVKAGEAGYQLTVGAVGPVVVTEHQLRDKDFQIRPRSALTQLEGDPPIKVYPKS